MDLTKQIEFVKNILSNLRSGNLKAALDCKEQLGSIIIQFYNLNRDPSKEELDLLLDIITIGDIVYNNADLDDDQQIIDNEVYDTLIVLYSRYRQRPVGSENVFFNNVNDSSIDNKALIPMVVDLEPLSVRDPLYEDSILNNFELDPYHYYNFKNYTDMVYMIPMSTGRTTAHDYPELVGTLDKVKCVLNKQAVDNGVFDDPNYTILERDFFRLHFEQNVVNGGQIFGGILSLKYDGSSVEGEVRTFIFGDEQVVMINTARTRGDTDADLGKDITHVLHGYQFYNADPNNFLEPLGVKFEAVMTYANLVAYNQERNADYKNPRSAIASILNSHDGGKYQKYITLVPLETSVKKDGDVTRLAEIEFINQELTTGEKLRCEYIEGDFNTMLFQIKKFVEEAEAYRKYLPIMYDGVVFEYADNIIRNTLGRKKSINQYAVAIKFDPLLKHTTFRRYEFTVGVTGKITPMIYFDPVDFYGGIHDHSSGHSYKRFNELNLKYGDILDIKYVNDVMPYVTKSDDLRNMNNTNEPYPFIKECPICGSKLVISPSEKNIFCPNIRCEGRQIAKMANMMSRLGMRGFSEMTAAKLPFRSFKEMIEATPEQVAILGEVNSMEFINRMNEIKTNTISDYVILGALGFTGISSSTWQLIMSNYTLKEIIETTDMSLLKIRLTSIKGIGDVIADTIIEELPSYMDDLLFILSMPNVLSSKGSAPRKKIRISGFRDAELTKNLFAQGYDISDKSVTKDTILLLVDDISTNKGGKVQTAIRYGIPVVAVNEFLSNPDKYLK